jgi:ferritin-like metal-binding protein YciE
MEGLVEEGLEQAGEIERRPVLDAAIIGAEQKAEHSRSPHMERLLRWESSLINNRRSSYCLRRWKRKKPDKKLTILAEQKFSPEAAGKS